jgi:hypothetical protein
VRRISAWVSLLLPLGLYGLTAARDVTLVDAGELLLAAVEPGVAHPPGFPTWTWLAWLASRVPLGAPALRVNLLSAFAGALAIHLLWRLCRAVVRRAGLGGGVWSEAGSLAAALAAAVAFPVWGFAVFTEVYTVTAALLVGSFAALVRARERGDRRWVWFSALLWSLAAGGHHVTAGLALPAWFWLAVEPRSGSRAPSKPGEGSAGASPSEGRLLDLLGLTLLFLPAVLLYLSLLHLGRRGPTLGWGGVVDLRHLWWHVSGKQYRVNLFSTDPGARHVELLRLRALALRSWTPALALIAGLAACLRDRAFRRNLGARTELVAMLLLIGFGVLFAFAYDIDEDKEAYYITATWSLSVLAAVGAAALLEGSERRGWRALAPGLLLLPVVTLVLNSASAPRQEDARARTFVEDLARTLEPGALVLTMQWQLYAPWLAFHHLEGFRPDVEMIDVNLVRRSWYLDYLQREMPGRMAGVAEELAAYRRELRRFEYGEPYDGARIQRAFLGLLEALIRGQLRRGGAVQIVPPMEPGLARDLLWVPWGLSFRLFDPDQAVPPPPDPLLHDEDRWVYDRWDIAGWKVLATYRELLQARVKREQRLGRPDLARRYRERLQRMSAVRPPAPIQARWRSRP